MDFEQHMTNSLTALLKKGESLQFSFYGVLRTGHLARPHEYYCFFGLAGKDLLIVGYSPLFHKNRFSVRIALPNLVKVKKAWVGEKYKLYFHSKNHELATLEKFRIEVKPECAKYKFQQENVVAFLSYIKER